MKLSYRLLAFMMALVGCIAASAAPMPKEKEKEHEGKNVDSGSFGVFQNGHRVGTETFSIYQTSNGSVIQSEFKTENAPTPAVQTSEMQLTASGDIRRYEWNELSPEKAESVVLPNDDFLTQKWRTGPQQKEQEQPYLLPASTSILDDYFFIHREVLAWKFLGAACKQEKGQVQCPLKQRAQFGTMNPHQHSSAPLSAEFLGREKVSLKGGQQDLIKLELKNDAGTWQLWLDDQFKVMRMSVVGENTEVDRD
ncbi:MAG: hypothetical protein ABR861_04080 [Terriglobales bacterium]